MRYSGDISDSFSRSLYQISGIEHVNGSVQNIRNIRFFPEHSQKKKKKNGCTKDILKCISLYSNFMLTILIKILYKWPLNLTGL